MTRQQLRKIQECYVQYCSVIKPLVARIEALSEKMPLPLFNEIRAFNDHIARCYYGNPSEEFIDIQINRAERHIARMTLDCFKCLIVILYEKIEQFDRTTRNIDLTVIDNGTFYPQYARLKIEGAALVRKAKELENRGEDDALYEFEKACNIYSLVVELIDKVSEKAKWARVRFTTRRIITVIAWVVSVVISAIISALFTCELFSNWLHW